jgi:hypothetical protein
LSSGPVAQAQEATEEACQRSSRYLERALHVDEAALDVEVAQEEAADLADPEAREAGEHAVGFLTCSTGFTSSSASSSAQLQAILNIAWWGGRGVAVADPAMGLPDAVYSAMFPTLAGRGRNNQLFRAIRFAT